MPRAAGLITLLLTLVSGGHANVQPRPRGRESTAAASAATEATPGRIFGVWYSGDGDVVSALPYLSGVQAAVQWADVEPVRGRYNFSGLDSGAAAALASVPRGRDARLTVQVNANRHPAWVFDAVPFTPRDATWGHEDEDPCPAGHTFPRGTVACVPQFWHPVFLQAYIDMLTALASHLAGAPYLSAIFGLRMNYDAVGTEGYGIPLASRDPAAWVVPPGATLAPRFDPSTTPLAYEKAVFEAHVRLFLGPAGGPVGPALLLVRNSLPAAVQDLPAVGWPNATTYRDLFHRGKLGLFHTSSELEPRAGDADRYMVFRDYCSRTTCYAEPWADAWGRHGSQTDARWCSPPQWLYWRILSDLSMGIQGVALYGTDLAVAAFGVYHGAQRPVPVGRDYQRAFNLSFSLARRYAGFLGKPEESPGAWLAFRRSVTPLGGYNSNVTDYSFHMAAGQDGGAHRIDARINGSAVPVVPGRTIPGLRSIGPYNQRFGAWAGVLFPGARQLLELDPVFALSLNGTVGLRLVALGSSRQAGVDGGGARGTGNASVEWTAFGGHGRITLDGMDSWVEHVVEVPVLTYNATILLRAVVAPVTLHMLEVLR